jgi:hypothetical protein
MIRSTPLCIKLVILFEMLGSDANMDKLQLVFSSSKGVSFFHGQQACNDSLLQHQIYLQHMKDIFTKKNNMLVLATQRAYSHM